MLRRPVETAIAKRSLPNLPLLRTVLVSSARSFSYIGNARRRDTSLNAHPRSAVTVRVRRRSMNAAILSIYMTKSLPIWLLLVGCCTQPAVNTNSVDLPSPATNYLDCEASAQEIVSGDPIINLAGRKRLIRDGMAARGFGDFGRVRAEPIEAPPVMPVPKVR